MLRAFGKAILFMGAVVILTIAIMVLAYFLHFWSIAVVFGGLFLLIWWLFYREGR